MINISDALWTRSYLSKKLLPVSFIENSITGNNYVVTGAISELWQEILEKQNYNDILEFAIKKNLNEFLDPFLNELKENGLIHTDILLKKSSSNYLFGINIRSDNFELFANKRKDFLVFNNFLGHIDLNLNYSCNLKCKHCCNIKNLNEYEIDIENAKKIIDEAYNLGVFSVTLTGGECTISRDFMEIAKYIKQKRLKLNILTNGQKLYDNKDFYEKFVSLFPSAVQTSLYSMNPDVHDNLTGVKGSHYKTIDIIKKLRQKNINVIIACFQTSYNKNSLLEVEEFAKSINADFTASCRFQHNPQNNNLDAKLSKEEIIDFYIKTIDINNPRNCTLKCSGGLDRLAVMPNLEVNPCNYCYYFAGNFKSMPLKEIREKTIKNFQRKIIKENLKNCYKHDYCEYCEYCSVFPCYTENNFLNKSEILCEDAQAYQKALQIKRNMQSL